MTELWVPPVRTPAPPDAVSRAYRSALEELGFSPSDIAVSILHAQGALETAHFEQCFNGNAGNIKRGKKWKGQYTTIKLNEVLKRGDTDVTVWFAPEGELTAKNGTIVPGTESLVPPGHLQTQMRAYESLEKGILDKVDFLAEPHWRPALDEALAGNPAGYVQKIHIRRYFTAPLSPYQRAVMSLTQKFLIVARGASKAPEELPPASEAQLCLDMAICHRFELPEWLREKTNQLMVSNADTLYREDEERRRADRDAVVQGKP